MPFAFVCEDDVHFSPSARAVLGELRMPVDEPAVTKLETYLVPALLSRTPFQKIGKHSVCELKSFHAGTGIYAINRAAAERLRAVWTEMILPIDKEMFEPGRASARGVTVFQVCPAPCIQLAMWPGRTAADESAAKSAIGAERMDAGANEGRRSRRFGPVGLAARLVYWSVQSLFLRSRGLKRAYLRFA
jgi:glycosyl transferase family 25